MNPTDLLEQRVVYQLPELAQQQVRSDIVYKSVEGIDLKMDLYYPAAFAKDRLLPVVVFVHGEAPWELSNNAKDWGQYTSWGRLAAACGLAAVTFTHRPSNGFTRLPEVACDVDDLLAFIRTHAAEFYLDADRIGLWGCSAGGPVGLSHVLRDRPAAIRCIAAYYPLLNLQQIEPLHPIVSLDVLQEFSPLYHLAQKDDALPPLLIARAGLDRPEFNATIDAFVAKALEQNRALDLLNHPSGQHGFDTRDDNARSKDIIEQTLEFFRRHLA